MNKLVATAVLDLQDSWNAQVDRALNTSCASHAEKARCLACAFDVARSGLQCLERSIKHVDGLMPLVKAQYERAHAALHVFGIVLEENKGNRYQAAVPLYTNASRAYDEALQHLHDAVELHGRPDKRPSLLRRASSASFFAVNQPPPSLAQQLSRQWNEETFAALNSPENASFRAKKDALLACISAMRRLLRAVPKPKHTLVVQGLLDVFQGLVNNKKIGHYQTAVPLYLVAQKEIETEIAQLDV